MTTNTSEDQHGGGDGVGESTGNWESGAHFYKTGFTLKQTRQVRLVEWTFHYDDNTISPSPVGPPKVLYITTPWSYIDINRWSTCCTPGEFQYMINNYSSIKLVNFKMKIFDINMKEVSKDAQGRTVVDNNLTGTMRIIVDEKFKYPYLMSESQWGILPNRPWTVMDLPQYCYCCLTDVDGTGKPAQGAAFWVLENDYAKMLRCGDEEQWEWKCETHWRDIFPKSQYLEHTHHPLLGQYFLKWEKDEHATH